VKEKEFNILAREITVDKELVKFLYLSAQKVLSEPSSALLTLILSR
jgi:hypothetical protein